jgi:hypothetical protein
LTRGYDVREVNLYDAINCEALPAPLSHSGPVRLLYLRARSGFAPLLTFKAFLQPPQEPSGSVLLLPDSPETSVVSRFYLFHELSHAARSGQVWELNSTRRGLRLALIYLPIALICDNMLAAGILFVLFGFNWLNENSDFAVEVDADWNAWKTYATIHPPGEVLRATRVVARLFELHAAQSRTPAPHLWRARFARKFGDGLIKRPNISDANRIPSILAPLVALVSVLIQACAAVLGYYNAVTSPHTWTTTILVFVMFFFLFRRPLSKKRYAFSLMHLAAVLESLRESD